MLAEAVIEMVGASAPPDIFPPDFQRRLPHVKSQVILQFALHRPSVVTGSKRIIPGQEQQPAGHQGQHQNQRRQAVIAVQEQRANAEQQRRRRRDERSP